MKKEKYGVNAKMEIMYSKLEAHSKYYRENKKKIDNILIL